MTGFEWVASASGTFGAPYVAIVSAFYGTLLATCTRFKARPDDLFALTAPIVLHLLLLLLVRNRQGLNAGHANVVVAAAVCVGLFAKLSTRVPVRWQTTAITLPGCAASIVAWLTIPFAPYMTFEIW